MIILINLNVALVILSAVIPKMKNKSRRISFYFKLLKSRKVRKRKSKRKLHS